ncbi:MAG: hypothetical protein NTX22_06230 [Ignavibacteriales bacterium]|nr:hypothetical protein [Ignavibacteriales bacterium]
MRKSIIIIFILFIGFTGCIRHSDQGLNKRIKNKSTLEKINLKKLTPNLMVNNIDSSVQFYKNIIGLEPVLYYPDSLNIQFVILAKGNIELMLQKKESFVDELNEFGDKQAGGTFNLYFEVNEILMVYEKAISKSIIIKELHQTLYGTKEFTIKDNNGYILTFSEPLKK